MGVSQYVCTCALCAGGGNAAALVAGSKWANAADAGATDAQTVVTYSFGGTTVAGLAAAAGTTGFAATMRAFGAADQATVRQVLAGISAVCNVRFVEVNDPADATIHYAYSQAPNDLGYTGLTWLPSASAAAGDVWIGLDQASPAWDYYRPYLLLHETLHALGLKHPFSGADVLSGADNIIPNTVMSYSAIAGASGGSLSDYPSQPMPMDVGALQYLYGASVHNAGDTVYDVSSAALRDGFQVIWDSGGRDRLDASHASGPVRLDLREGAWSDIGAAVQAFGDAAGGTAAQHVVYSATLAIATGSVIEDAAGSAFDDTITGNDGDNRIDAGAGNDRIAALGGNDTIDGGDGIDTAVYAMARADCTVSVTPAGITVTADGKIDRLTNVERLSFGDVALAFDLDGNAGTAARMVGAIWGAGAVADAARVGATLAALDGGMSARDFAQSLLDTIPGAPLSNTAFVDIVYANVVGHAPSPADEAYYVHLLDSGAIGQAALAVRASQTDANALHIGLAGLAHDGLAYIPAA